MKRYRLAQTIEWTQNKNHLNNLALRLEKSQPIIDQVSEDIKYLYLFVLLEWGKNSDSSPDTNGKIKSNLESNVESMRSFGKKIEKWKEYFPNLSYYQIVEKINKGEELPRRKMNFGKLVNNKEIKS